VSATVSLLSVGLLQVYAMFLHTTFTLTAFDEQNICINIGLDGTFCYICQTGGQRHFAQQI
jgi:hypothetical protein